MKLTLLHKGLLLVSIPLCFEITIFGALFNLQKQAEVEAQKVARNKKINDAVNHIMIYGIRLGRVRNKYELSEFLAPSFQNNAHELKTNFAELESLTHDDPNLSQQVEFSKRSMFAALGHFKDIKEALQTADPSALPDLIRDNRKNLDRDIDSARATGLLELADKSLAGTDDARSRLLRERATTLLKYAVGLSVLMGIVGATMFSKHLTRRLQKLGDNASKLARQEPLDAPQEGTDEIAELDRSFHYAASLITQATRIRQEVTALITNDLKTPLQAIIAFLELLGAGELGPVDQQGAALLAISEKESQRMVGLIDNVLQLEQLRTGTLKLDLSTVSVVSLLNKSIDAIHIPADEKNIELRRDFSQSGDEAVQGDPFWLGQVIVNILSNAIKFSPQQTVVIVHAESTATQVKISISDQGPGIPPEQLDLIFERFHRIEASAAKVSGSGLGLTIARELVEMHNGSIDIVSEGGQGSTFNIRLPRSKKSLGDASTAAAQAAAQRGDA